MKGTNPKETIRLAARGYEQGLPAEQRKLLGQYFTGLPLGRLLAHLAIEPWMRSALDPMAGHGDLLDATWEAASQRRIQLDHLHGIEVDSETALWCDKRITAILGDESKPNHCILIGSAFDADTVSQLPIIEYDLVITNPPYVRYQSLNAHAPRRTDPRAGLQHIIAASKSAIAREVWHDLAKGYSGHADLSVPSWLLAALLVKPGGRLAIVVPATWRSRNYADPIRYLLLRAFSTEYIVEDTRPGWFSDALVRTQLIVARRLNGSDTRLPLRSRQALPKAVAVRISPSAASDVSLVGSAFKRRTPEAVFAAWVQDPNTKPRTGLERREVAQQDEWAQVESRSMQRQWFQTLEGGVTDLPLFGNTRESSGPPIPENIREVLSGQGQPVLAKLESNGISVSQGLRTGCNGFFYVTQVRHVRDGKVRVQASSILGYREFEVPVDSVRPVLRRQTELQIVERGEVPISRVLDLRCWMLPEDFATVEDARQSYSAAGRPIPRIMPDALAEFVRLAAQTSIESFNSSKRIPELSAVLTNVRIPRTDNGVPRFWYMLPDFTARHVPSAFVARINHNTPWVEANQAPPFVVDANFSTIWTDDSSWTPFALKAFLNSLWCRLCMEALGTALGGGALKLEATQLRQLPVPLLDRASRKHLDMLGRQLTRTAADTQSKIDWLVLSALLPNDNGPSPAEGTVSRITAKIEELRQYRVG